MVLFKDDPEQYNLPDMFLNVQTNITQVLDLVKQINKMEEEIILNPMVGRAQNCTIYRVLYVLDYVYI